MLEKNLLFIKIRYKYCISKVVSRNFETVLEAIFNTEGLKGVVLETYGAGNCTTEDWFLDY